MKKFSLIWACICLIVYFVFFPIIASANTLSDLQQQINANGALLKQKTAEANSLQKQVAIFDTQIRDAELQISKTQVEVNQTQTEIVKLQEQIKQKEDELKIQKENLFETMKVMYETGNDQSMLEIVASSNTLSDLIDKSQYLESVRENVNKTVNSIQKIKSDLETNKTDQENKKKESEDLLAQQEGYRQSLSSQKAAKDQLLSQTKGEESEYQKRLNEAWKEYQDALSRSRQSNGSSYIGGSGSGYLINPDPNGSLTQGYGCTQFAQCGDPGGPYGGNIHNGLDISAGYGSSIKAAADGVVMDRGEEYNSHGWGNWIIIRHPNGLATLYGHLSSFRVSAGQSVSKGDEIGLEGNTGFSTGSHLHFSVFTNLVIYNGAYHGPVYSGTVDPRQFL